MEGAFFPLALINLAVDCSERSPLSAGVPEYRLTELFH